VRVLTPPRVWRQTHNYHHAHTAKIVGSHVGSYAMLTTDLWAKTPRKLQRMYKITRHPLTIAAGYVTIFLYGMCLASFARNPRKNWDSALALLVHAALCAAVGYFFGAAVLLFAVTLPLTIAFAVGAYLFYAQHNFPDIEVQPRESWEYTRAALGSSSYMKTGPVMAFFTGNIGYHHVHHLNPGIPFYRLPEAMAGIPELQRPHVTTLHPRDIVANFKLKLWDPHAGRMVGYPAPAGATHDEAQQAA
jgi:omega-6 fatty acid desaturase (delta-12 desaturase)